MKSYYVLLVGLVACSPEAAPVATQHQTATEPAMTVRSEQFASTVPLDGTVRPRHRIEIATRMMGRVTDVRADIGDAVRRGAILVSLGADDVAASRARVTAALTMATAARDEAQRHADRMTRLHDEDVVPRVEVDRARLALTRADAELGIAAAAVDEVTIAESYATLRAPIDGTIMSRNVDPGDLAAPGVPLLVLQSNATPEGVIDAPAQLAVHVTPGDTLLLDGQGGALGFGVVRAVGASADPSTRTVEVRLSVPKGWLPGTALTGWFAGPPRTGIAVDQSFIVRRGQLVGVRVVTDDGVALRWVRLGPTIRDAEGRATRVEVVSGLRDGDRIVR